MATEYKNEVFEEEFLMDLIYTCLENEYILSVVCQHIENSYLPDRESQAIMRILKQSYKDRKKAPDASIILQKLSGNKQASHFMRDILETAGAIEQGQCLDQIEEYIRRVKYTNAIKDSSIFYNQGKFQQSHKAIQEYVEWANIFSLHNSEFIDVIGSFESQFMENRQKHNQGNTYQPITRFYIDDLDAANEGRDLRTQLSCILAPTGVGKSHAARWIGKNACQIDGLHVLHFQLEGSKEEVVNAYAASLVECSSFKYSSGVLRNTELEHYKELIKGAAGTLHVKSYPKFNSHVSTIDIRDSIREFKKVHHIDPDVVIIDSMDLLTDASGKKYRDDGERHKRIAVANDLKDLAADENVWMVVTYQSTIENRDWLNDEKNVLTEYNTAEAKGLARPMTHLITLNQSDNERREHTMRLNVAKSRFFEKPPFFKIATNYDNEQFYDRKRTLQLAKLG